MWRYATAKAIVCPQRIFPYAFCFDLEKLLCKYAAGTELLAVRTIRSPEYSISWIIAFWLYTRVLHNLCMLYISCYKIPLTPTKSKVSLPVRPISKHLLKLKTIAYKVICRNSRRDYRFCINIHITYCFSFLCNSQGRQLCHVIQGKPCSGAKTEPESL